MLHLLTSPSRNTIAIKIILYLSMLLSSIPIFSLIYWAFDTSYLGAFGIGPEFYNRPIFSSPLINAWLLIYTIEPTILALIAASILIFIIILIFRWHKNIANTQTSGTHNASTSTNKNYSHLTFICDLLLAISIFLLIVLIIFLLILSPIIMFSDKSKGLANKQIEAYTIKNICKDLFYEHHHGCYTIPGESGNDHLLIANNNDVIIYMSRHENSANDHTFSVTVKNKLSHTKIVRHYKLATDSRDSTKPL